MLTICSLGVAAVKNVLGPQNERKFLKINVQSSTAATFLYDPGSMVTLMSEKEFRRIPLEKRPKQISFRANLTGVAQNSPLNLKGVYPIELEIAGRKTTVPVLLLKK